MLWSTVVSTATRETGYRSVVNPITATLTLTARSIGTGEPLILATNSASLNGIYARRPATSTSVVNNLFLGILEQAPMNTYTSTANPARYLDSDQDGLALVYGLGTAIVQAQTDSWAAGSLLIPTDLQMMIPSGGPVTASAATATAAHGLTPAIGGLAYLAEDLASSSATATVTAKVFLRAV